MKHTLNSLLVILLALMATTTIAQTFYVRGIVTSQNNPVAGASVLIEVLPANQNQPISFTTVTDSMGSFSIQAPRSQNPENAPTKVKASVADCNGVLVSQVQVLAPNAPGIEFFFNICRSNNENDSCSVNIVPIQSNIGQKELLAKAVGQGPFRYLWSNGATTEKIPLEDGQQYCVTITSANGCSASDCFIIVSDPCKVNITQGIINGVTYLIARPIGVAPFTFTWSNGETTDRIEAKPGERYCVTIVDSRNCQANACITVAGTGGDCKVKISIEQGDSTRFLRAHAIGNAPFQYLWNTGETTPRIVMQGDTLYCVTITDATGCTASACFESKPPVKCAVSIRRTLSSNGEIYLVALANGEAPFTYLWQDSSTNDRIQFEPGKQYCVTITSANGCTASTCLNVPTDRPCKVSIARIAQGGTTTLVAIMNPPGNATFEWSTGETTPRIQVTNPGIYCVTVTTDRGCVAKACITVKDSSENANCIPGSIQVLYEPDSMSATLRFVSPQNGPFLYRWSTGQNTPEITVDQSGAYILTVIDPTRPNCVSVFRVNIEFAKNTCQAVIVARPVDSMNVQLFAFPIPNNLPVAKYLWSTGDTTASIIVPRSQDTFCVTIQFAGCIATTCYRTFNSPNIYIQGLPISANHTQLSVVAEGLQTTNPALIIWSNGDIGNTIVVDNAGWHDATIFTENDEVHTVSFFVENRVKRQYQEVQLQTYPNPVTDWCNVKFVNTLSDEFITFEWINAQGLIIHSKTMRAQEGEHNFSFDLSNWPSGMYILKMSGQQGQYTQRILKN
jgi:hypothetical protein